MLGRGLDLRARGDLDIFGETVKLASRIADVAAAGEVLASEAVVEAAADDRFGYERIEDALLEGLPSPVALYRLSLSGSAVAS